ncbi:MAG TPA: phosphatase PAP2 family protein [Geminicoccaceae bacterium]|nr:phosphatase PAP2 family protein [Geminicoccaceae bacterium]
MTGWLVRLIDYLRRTGMTEVRALVLLALVAAGAFGFVQLADEVLEGETRTIDETLLLLLRARGDPSEPWGPVWLEEFGRDITALGSMGVLTLVTLGVAGYFAFTRSAREALLLLLAIGGGMVLVTLMKSGFDRPRPDLVPHGTRVVTASFPSGHAMMAAVTYLTLGALLARAQEHWRVKAYLLGFAVLVTVLVGVSRVYLGVHWPSDVLAGWVAGASWAALCWILVSWEERGK